MYYKDSITLDFDADSVDDSAWVVENNTLRMRQPDKLDKCFYSLTLSFTGTELVHGKYKMPVSTKHYVNVRVRSWKTNKYSLQKCTHDWGTPRFVKEFNDNVLFFIDNVLYVRGLHERGKRRVCKMYISYDEGMEISRQDDYYALRNGTRILINKGLQGEWRVIFDKKDSTGIRNSMVWVRNEQKELELLFSEYTITWGRHHIYCYNVVKEELAIRQTFYSIDEHNAQRLEPFARHTHLMIQDPCTGYIYIGNGDYSDGSSSIYYSKDNCKTLIRIGSYSQEYRTLSFMFTEKSVFWNMDSPYEPQYICRLDRKDLPMVSVEKSPIVKYPLIHSAHWLIEPLKTDDGETMYVMSSNRESAFYDNRIRTFGIKIVNEEPEFYELLALPYDGSIFHQYYPMGVGDNQILLMDTTTHRRAFYRLVKRKE
ncbi:MAG: hypothetical protein IKT08_00445 [Bacteroidales bacterium]|nr:hypothetical protein [Bacteroidales bacterium]